MSNGGMIVCGDGHFHLYPGCDVVRTFSELIRNLDVLIQFARRNFKVGPPLAARRSDRTASASRGPTLTGLSIMDQEREIFRLAFLTEGRLFDYFQKISRKEIAFEQVGLEVSPGPEEHCLTFSRDGKLQLVLVAGRQIATTERLEILGLGMEKKIPDGLPAEEIIENILIAGGLPVLPFSPGKWLFGRGKMVRHLADKYGRKLIIGDSALRPAGWGKPEIMRRAREIKQAVLAGSDPLPLAGDEKYAGCYGFVYQGQFDSSRPLTAIKDIIANKPETIVAAGKRRSLTNVMLSLYRLQRFKERHIGT